MKKYVLTALILFVWMFPLLVSAQTPPEEFLGHKVGADRKLADYTQIRKYFSVLDQESDKIKVLNIGESTLGKPMIMAVITSESNMAQLDRYRDISRQLRNARGLTEQQAKDLAREGKVIVLITCSLHATEIAASQMSMEFAYNLVTGQTPFDSSNVLDDVIILLSPTINPDGEQMVTEWYRKYVGTEYEGSRMPWLYHHYAGHDNNRDWFMFNLAESRAVTKVLYHDWIPQIHIDEHQMGSTGARLFVPPFDNPPIPNVHPLVWRGIALMGMNMAYDLQKQDFKGVVHGRSFTGWWIGACDDTSWLHNSIGLLSEMASVKTATPIYIEPNELPDSYVEKRMQFPDPWLGGWWRLRDIVEYELALSNSLVKTAYLHKEDFLYNFFKMNKDAIEVQPEDEPYAFVIPKKQRDYPTMLRMLEILRLGGVEIHQAETEFIADGKIYPEGSFIVDLSQPYRPYAQALLEKQEYPDMRQYPGGPPVPPYDNAGWTLPLQMGVVCDRIDSPIDADMERLETIPLPEITPSAPDAAYILLDSKANASYAAAFTLLNKGAEIFRTRKSVDKDEIQACPGSFLLVNNSMVQEKLPEILQSIHLQAQSLDDITGIEKDALKLPRVGLYQSWKANMDEGWTRYVLDDLGISYTRLHNKDFKSDKELQKRFEVIIFADENPDIIVEGKPKPGSRYARYYTEGPPEYEGGIGKEGVKALKNFVAEGGRLITLNSASSFAINEFKPPVSNVLENVSRDEFFCPTSILRINVNNQEPLGYGMPSQAAAVFARSLAFQTSIPTGEWDRSVVASFPKDDVLLSGWLLGEDTISRKAAVVDTAYKKGRVILIGIRSQHRAQSHGTYKFLLNGILYPELSE
jgi:hypothetical protein